MSKVTLTAFLSLSLFSITQIFSQNTSIPDSNFEQALIDEGIDSDGTINGLVLTADVQFISNLNVRNKNIFDLTGIEAFTALQTLNFGQNNVSNVDLSNNINLTGLLCFTNNLASLDLSNNTSLTSVNCSGNQLSSIDISLNTQLTGFFCALNNLISLDVTTNNLLEKLWCYDNNLTELKVNNGANALLAGTYSDPFNTYSRFRSGTNSSLTCIFVDNATDANNLTGDYLNWEIDVASTFVETQGECNSLSIVNFEVNQFSVYPNPFKDSFNVISKQSIASYELYDNLGKLKYNEKTIDFTKLESGLYFLKLKDQNNNIIIKKIVKK